MTRKSKTDWLQAGLDVLAKTGLSGLTIDAMSHELGLTKGSFYHHFENIHDFENQLLFYWANQYLSTADSLPNDPQERLTLLDAIMEDTYSDITAPEIAIRSWAQDDDRALPFVERVDAFRRNIVYEIFLSQVDDPNQASLMTDLLFTLTIGSMASLPPIPPARVLELYQELKRLYDL